MGVDDCLKYRKRKISIAKSCVATDGDHNAVITFLKDDFPLTSATLHHRPQITGRVFSLLNQQLDECQEANTLAATIRLPQDYRKPPRWVTVTVTVVGVRGFWEKKPCNFVVVNRRAKD